MILRTSYLEEIKEVIDKPLIKVLVGMRRAGKSTLLNQIQEYLVNNGVSSDQIISLDFEWLEFEELLNYKKLYEYINTQMVGDGKYYIFLDEIQEVEGFEKVVNSLNAKGNTDLYITGSNSNLLSGELATYLTGRYYQIEVLPLSFEEIYDEASEKDIEQQFLDYIRIGGLPGCLVFDAESTSKNYRRDLYSSILLKDIVKRYKVRDVELLQRFMKYMMNNVGQIFSAGSITKYLKNEGRKLSKETIYNYIDAAKNTYLIHGVPRYNLKGKTLLKTNEKYFINDLGLRSLYFDNEKDIGQALENIVYMTLRSWGYEIFVGQYDDKEVDFIAKKDNEKIYVQVTYLLAEETTIEREFSVLEQIDDNFEKYVVSMDKISRSRNGIKHVNIIDFILSSDKKVSE